MMLFGIDVANIILFWFVLPSLICLPFTFILNLAWEVKLATSLGLLGGVYLGLIAYTTVNEYLVLTLMFITGIVCIIPLWRKYISQLMIVRKSVQRVYKYLFPLGACFFWFWICPFWVIGATAWAYKLSKQELEKTTMKKPEGKLEKWKDVREEEAD